MNITRKYGQKYGTFTYLHQLDPEDLPLIWPPWWKFRIWFSPGVWRVLGAHLPTWQNRFVQDLLFRGREPRAVGLPGVQRGNGKSHGNQWRFFLLGKPWENWGKSTVNGGLNGKTMGKSRKIHNQWRFFWGKTMGKSRKIHCQWRCFLGENHGKI